MSMNSSKNIILIIGIIVIVAIFSFYLWWTKLVEFQNKSYLNENLPPTSTSTVPIATSTKPVSVNKNVTLAIGQSEKAGDLKITLNAFVQDSRCPIDVVCIQAGAVNVNVTLTDTTHYITKNFPSDEVPYSFGNYRISIVDIAPPRQSQKEILTDQYRITFHVVSK